VCNVVLINTPKRAVVVVQPSRTVAEDILFLRWDYSNVWTAFNCAFTYLLMCIGESSQVQPAACEFRPLPRWTVQLSNGRVASHLPHSLLVHHIRRLAWWFVAISYYLFLLLIYYSVFKVILFAHLDVDLTSPKNLALTFLDYSGHCWIVFCTIQLGHCGPCRKRRCLTDLNPCCCVRDPDDVSHCRLVPFDGAGWWFVQTPLCRWWCGPVPGKPQKVNPHPKREKEEKEYLFVLIIHQSL